MQETSPNKWLLAAGALGVLISGPAMPAPGENQPPVADAGGPYFEQCQGDLTLVQFDGSGSYDLDGTALEFFWFEECSNAWFDDPTSPTPILNVLGSGCEYSCQAIDLTVTSGGQSDKTHALAVVSDTLAPKLVIPGDVYQPWGIDTTPVGTGLAIAADTCDPKPMIGFSDFAYTPGEKGMERIIVRTWTVEDNCGNFTSDVQRIHLLGQHFGGYNLEVDPNGCGEDFLMRAASPSFSVYIGGGPKMNVLDLDLSSLHFSMRENPSASMSISALGGPLATDVLMSMAQGPQQCNPAGTDGWLDQEVILNRARMCSMMRFGPLIGGQLELLTVAGQQLDGTWFWAQTELRILN